MRIPLSPTTLLSAEKYYRFPDIYLVWYPDSLLPHRLNPSWGRPLAHAASCANSFLQRIIHHIKGEAGLLRLHVLAITKHIADVRSLPPSLTPTSRKPLTTSLSPWSYNRERPPTGRSYGSGSDYVLLRKDYLACVIACCSFSYPMVWVVVRFPFLPFSHL